MGTIEINKAVNELKELEAMAAEITAEIDNIKDALKAELIRRKIDELSAGVFKIRYKTVTSKRFDTKAFKQSHEDLYNEYAKESVSKRFTVS